MFTDTQNLTINAVAVATTRKGNATPDRLGSFRNSDGTVMLDVRQNSTKTRFRREVRLTQKKIAADPFTAVNKEVSASVIIAIDEPASGFTDLELGYLHSALDAWFTTGLRTQLLEGDT